MLINLFELINYQDYDKVLSLIIEYETEKILSLPKKTHSTLSKDKQTSLQNTINSLLSTYKASGKLDSCKESYQIIMLLNYLVQIRVILDNTNNDRRFEESYKKIKDWKLIPLKEEDNEQFVSKDFLFNMIFYFKREIFISL